jgi:hypothetical protein
VAVGSPNASPTLAIPTLANPTATAAASSPNQPNAHCVICQDYILPVGIRY